MIYLSVKCFLTKFEESIFEETANKIANQEIFEKISALITKIHQKKARSAVMKKK